MNNTITETENKESISMELDSKKIKEECELLLELINKISEEGYAEFTKFIDKLTPEQIEQFSNEFIKSLKEIKSGNICK